MLGQSEVDVSLPRFKMAERYKLKEVLISMGMKDAFDVGMSDFSGETRATNTAHAHSNVIFEGICKVNSLNELNEYTTISHTERRLHHWLRVETLFCRQACLQATTLSCQKSSTRLLWMWTRREPRRPPPLPLSWLNAQRQFLRSSTPTTPSSSSSDTTRAITFSLPADTAPQSEQRTPFQGEWGYSTSIIAREPISLLEYPVF